MLSRVLSKWNKRWDDCNTLINNGDQTTSFLLGSLSLLNCDPESPLTFVQLYDMEHEQELKAHCKDLSYSSSELYGLGFTNRHLRWFDLEKDQELLVNYGENYPL